MSWDSLRPLLLRAGVPSELFDPVRAVLDAASPDRDAGLSRMATALTADGHAARLLSALAAGDADARRLALDLATRLPPPLDARAVHRVRPLLRDRQLPSRARVAAAVALTRTTGPSGTATMRVLRDFAAGVGKFRALQRVRALRRRFGHLPVFGPFLTYLRRKVKLRCPRCRTKLPRRAMVRHVWQRHGTLLVGRRMTTPWNLIDVWGATDPGHGLVRLHRWMLRHGLNDGEAGDHLRRAAADAGATVCPACFALVPLAADEFPDPVSVKPLAASRGRLAADGYVVDVSERGLYPRLRIETPRGMLAAGREPGGRLTHRAAVWFGVVPWVVLAGLLALTTPPDLAPLATAAALCVAFIVRLVLQGRREQIADATDRAIDYAWSALAPRLHADGFDGGDAAFLARLAVTSVGRGTPGARDATVQRLVGTTAGALRAGRARATDLAALVRLAVADAPAADADPVVRLAEAIRPCLTGDAPPALAELVLTDDVLAGWTVGPRARLRVLLAARAFEAGLTVVDLHDVGRAVPALGRALGSADTDGLARLRLLWELRPARPWQVCGPAATVFELANYPMLGGQHLEAAPDLLLYQPLPATGGPGPPAPLLVCGRGLLYRDALLHDPATPIDVSETRGGYELMFGRHRLPCRADPAELARKLTRWANYYFKEFLPQTEAMLHGRPDGAARLLRPLAVTCPKCAASFLGRRGDLGERA